MPSVSGKAATLSVSDVSRTEAAVTCRPGASWTRWSSPAPCGSCPSAAASGACAASCSRAPGRQLSATSARARWEGCTRINHRDDDMGREQRRRASERRTRSARTAARPARAHTRWQLFPMHERVRTLETPCGEGVPPGLLRCAGDDPGVPGPFFTDGPPGGGGGGAGEPAAMERTLAVNYVNQRCCTILQLLVRIPEAIV